MKRVFLLLYSCCLFFTLQSTAQVYVSPAGVDAPGNGTQGNPYQTIQYAHDNAAAGSIVNIGPGTYFITAPITITKHITLLGANGGQSIISGSSWAGSNKHMIHIENVNRVQLSKLTIQDCIGSGACGIYVAGVCDSIGIEGCFIRNIGWQSNDLITPPTNVSLHNAHAVRVLGTGANPIKRFHMLACGISNCATGFSEAIAISGYVQGAIFESGHVDSVQNIGIDLAGGYGVNSNPANDYPNLCIVRNSRITNCMSAKKLSAGIYLDGATSCIIDGNLLQNNGVGISVGAEQTGVSPVYSNFIRNNAVIGNVAAGVYIGSSNPANIVNRTYLYNNTFFKNRTGQPVNGVTQVDGVPVASYGDVNGGEIHLLNNNETEVYNNIIYARDGHQNLLVLNGYTTTDYESDYNLYYRDDNGISLQITNGNLGFNGAVTSGYFDVDDFKASYGLDSHSIVKQNPIFAFPNEVGTTAISPGVDKGTPIYVQGFHGTIDFYRADRVWNGIRIDIGAVEFNGMPTNSAAKAVKPVSAFTLYPNPVVDGILHISPAAALVEVYDLQGRRLIARERADRVDVSHLAAGSYWVKGYDADGNVVVREQVVVR